MNIIQEDDKINNIQNHQLYYDIKDPYSESLIPITDEYSENNESLRKMENLYNHFPDFKKLIEAGNQEKVSSYFGCFSELIDKLIFDTNEPFDYIEFIFPYIIELINIETPKTILKLVLRSLFFIIPKSHYYSLQFSNSSALQQLILIIQKNITDYISGISINIILMLSNYEELQNICYSIFSIQSLGKYFLSNDYKELSKEGFIQIYGKYLFSTDDDEKISEIFSSILQCLNQPKLDIHYSLQLLGLIGSFYDKNNEKNIELIPGKIISFISDNLLEIIKNTHTEQSRGIFYLIHILVKEGVVFYYPVEELYQIVLNEKTEKIIKSRIMEMISQSIKIYDDIEYLKLFITKSLQDVIEYSLENGSISTKCNCLILIAIITATENMELLVSFIYSSSFTSFLDFIEITDDINSIIVSIGILGSALQLLKVRSLDSEEFNFFMSHILSSNIFENIYKFAEKYDKFSKLLMAFCSLFESESTIMSENC